MGPKMQNLFQNIAKFIEKKCTKRAETIRKKFTRNGDQKIAKAKKCHFFLKKSKKNHETRELFRFFHSHQIPLFFIFFFTKTRFYSAITKRSGKFCHHQIPLFFIFFFTKTRFYSVITKRTEKFHEHQIPLFFKKNILKSRLYSVIKKRPRKTCHHQNLTFF